MEVNISKSYMIGYFTTNTLSIFLSVYFENSNYLNLNLQRLFVISYTFYNQHDNIPFFSINDTQIECRYQEKACMIDNYGAQLISKTVPTLIHHAHVTIYLQSV